MMYLRILCILAFACGFLMSCSGSNGNSGDQLGIGGDGRITDPAVLPVSGSARYDGFLTLGLPTSRGREPFTGDLRLDVNFDAAATQVTGEASKFLAPDNEELIGRIIVTDGDLDRDTDIASDYTFEGQISGTLQGSEFRNLVVSGTILGDFNGDKAEVLVGRTFGDLIGPDGDDLFNGSFSTATDDVP